MVGTMPKKFDGTDEQRQANNASHHFCWYDEDARCLDCDCRPYSRTADWPCCEPVPRVQIGSQADVAGAILDITTAVAIRAATRS